MFWGLFGKRYRLVYRIAGFESSIKVSSFKKVVEHVQSGGVIHVERNGVTIYNLAESWHYWTLNAKERKLLGFTGPRYENRPR